MNVNQTDYATYRSMISPDDTYTSTILAFWWGDTGSTLPAIVRDTNILPDNSYYDLVEEGCQEVNAAERAELFRQAQQILMDTTCNIPLVSEKAVYAYNEKALPGIQFVNNGICALILLNDVK